MLCLFASKGVSSFGFLFSFCWTATFLIVHCKIWKGEIAQNGDRREDWLPSSSSIFISFFNHPQLKCTHHYFQLVWAVLSAADLVEREQNLRAWGHQTHCLLHRKALVKPFLAFNLFPAFSAAFSAQTLVHSLSRRHLQITATRPVRETRTPPPLKEQSGEQQGQVWEQASPKSGSALLLPLSPLPA